MARPALVVGLGGTGQWVLTWLKRDLMLSNNGVLPKNVRLLSIDTCTQLEAGTKRVTSEGKEEEGVALGNISLDAGEFIYLGGDSRPLAERVKKGGLAQIGRWYKAQTWLDTQPPTAFILDEGAGRIRQFGRMAIFKDLLGQEAESKLWQACHSALEGVRNAVSEKRRLEIIVVGSFAGGTGSGMFLDVALVLRMIATQNKIPHLLRGFFALPNVFTNNPDENMRARTFAAWRELNRFMVVNSDFPMPAIEYVPDKSKFRIEPKERIFDACYLLDGKRNGQPLADDAKWGVFPMTAEVISAILDEYTGSAYSQWVTTNLSEQYAKHPDLPMYSAVGAYTVQVPAHFVQEISSIEFSQDLLLRLLEPRRQPDEYGRLLASGADRHLALAAPDHNQEDKGFTGSARSQRLFTETVNYQGRNSKPTLYMARIAALNSQVEAGDRARIVEDIARSSTTGKGWAGIYTDLGDDPAFEAVKKDVNEFMNYRPMNLRRRDKEKAEEARARFRAIPEQVRTYYGGAITSDDGVDEFYGQFGEVLDKVAKTHLQIFRRHLQTRLLEILMGRSDNALIARSGKLGYAWDFLKGGVQEVDNFLKTMDEVRRKRENIKPELKLREQLERSEKLMQEMLGKRFLLFWESPEVQQSEDNYLRIWTKLVDVRREEILHIYVTETARHMKQILADTRDTVQSWIWHLTTGDDSSGLPGLWDGIRRNKEALKTAHGYDTKTKQVQLLLKDTPHTFKESDLIRAMERLEWVIQTNEANAQLEINLVIKPEVEGEPVSELKNPVSSNQGNLRAIIGGANQGNWLNLARRQFAGVVARTTIAQAIKEAYPDPNQFVMAVAQVSAEPLFDGDAEATPLRKNNLIRIQSEEPYFTDKVQGELRYRNNLSREVRSEEYGIQVVGSEHPYKLTLMRSNDLYRFDHFNSWHQTLAAYQSHVFQEGDLLDPVLLHNFPAEQTSVSFEKQLTQEPYNREYAPLHPRVVMLLEDIVALRQFLYLGMLGLIEENEDERGMYRWELSWEKSTGPQTFWLTRGWNDEQHGKDRPKPDIFNAMHGYIIMRQTQQEGRRDKIDMEFAERLIQSKLPDLEDREALLKEHLADEGFIGWLRLQAMDVDVPERIIRQDFYDLALVAELVIKSSLERVSSKIIQKDPKQPKGPFGIRK